MSPHFGLIKENELTPDELVLMRARLHWRCGRRRLRENKTASAIATLYDALLSGMRWYLMVDKEIKPPDYSTEALENERYVFHLMRKKGILDQSFNLARIQTLVDMALMEEDIGAVRDSVVSDMEEFLTRLKVLPFDESKLPPEDPTTF